MAHGPQGEQYGGGVHTASSPHDRGTSGPVGMRDQFESLVGKGSPLLGTVALCCVDLVGGSQPRCVEWGGVTPTVGGAIRVTTNHHDLTLY